MADVLIVVFDPETGLLLGSGMIPENLTYPNSIVVSQEVYDNWELYWANAARDGVEFRPDCFVTYAEPDGNLISRYEAPYGTGPTQPNSIQVTRQVYEIWQQYRMTVDRTGIRLILSDAQILANYKPQIRDRMEFNAKAAGFGSLAEAIRWKDRTGSAYEQHGQDWNDYEAAVWAYCTMVLVRDEPPFEVFLANLDTNVPPPAAIPYPF